MFFLLFVLVILVSLYDLKYRKVPNLISLPLIIIGFVLVGFPGNLVLWMGRQRHSLPLALARELRDLRGEEL